MTALEAIVMRGSVQADKQREAQYLPANGLSRFMFLEMLIRIAVFLYVDKSPGNSLQTENQEYAVKISDALNIFVRELLKPYHTSLNLRTGEYR